MIFNENMSVRETLPKFLKDALGQSRHGRIAQNQEGVDRCNAEIGANEDIANNGNEQPEIRERECIFYRLTDGSPTSVNISVSRGSCILCYNGRCLLFFYFAR